MARTRRRRLSETSQRRAIDRYRKRLADCGMARFEVLGRKADRELIRSVAKYLAEEGPGAERLRSVVSRCMAGEPGRKGGILQALLRSPLVRADVVPPRPFETGRKVDL